MRKPASLRMLLSAVALCAAASAQAAPHCTATGPHATWDDCASVFAGYDAAGGGGAGNTLTFDAAFSPVPFAGNDAAMTAITFATQGTSANEHSVALGSVLAATPVAAIPEPHTNLLMLAGLAAIGFMATRRRRP